METLVSTGKSVAELIELLNAKIVSNGASENVVIEHAFASDLMSDVLTISQDNLMLITGLACIQTIRTAELKDISVILFVRGKKVPQQLIQEAEEDGITLLEYSGSMFKAAGLLCNAGIKPVY